jgi:hypothetical protein
VGDDRHPRLGARHDPGRVHRSSVSALAKVAANNDASSRVRTSRVRVPATGGRVYPIAVDGRSSATGALTLNLKLG